MSTAKKFSVANFSTRKAAPFRAEYKLPDGTGTGWFFLIYADNAAPVVAKRNEIIDENNKRDAANQVRINKGEVVDPIPMAQAVATNHQLTAARVAGWEGPDEPFTPELALTVVDESPEIANWVIKTSQEVGNFIKR